MLNITGDYMQQAAGTLQIELAGNGGLPGNDFDQLSVTGNTTLAGTLQILPIAGFVPEYGDRFEVLTYGSLTGRFDAIAGAVVDDGLTLAPDFGATAMTLEAALPGDGDLNGLVNFNDFVLITNNFSNSGTDWNQGNFNLDGLTNFHDFVILTNHFGAVASNQSTPEPSGVALLCMGILFTRHRGRKGVHLGHCDRIMRRDKSEERRRVWSLEFREDRH